jgi:hypothetical protein
MPFHSMAISVPVCVMFTCVLTLRNFILFYFILFLISTINRQDNCDSRIGKFILCVVCCDDFIFVLYYFSLYVRTCCVLKTSV